MHNDINEDQVMLLRQLRKRIIVVPDYDRAGMELAHKALELGFHISLPKWENGIKDVNDSVVKYGRLATTLSILQNVTTSRILLHMMENKIESRLHP